jgi:sigma-B regulation protein RsbU (phosphoserine phosphatase)
MIQRTISPEKRLKRRRFNAGGELAKLAVAQRRLMPTAAPIVPGYRLAFAYRPAYFASGDYCDFFHRRNGLLATFIGDGSGHGPAASILMAAMRTIFHTHPEFHSDPGRTLSQAGRLFHDVVAPDLFMTGVYLLFEGGDTVSWASAGQDPPLRVKFRGEVALPDLTPVRPPLGVRHGERYPTVGWHLEPGERLFLFTDGLVEARNPAGEAFGRPRLQGYLTDMCFRPLEKMVAEIVKKAIMHTQGADFEDDFTIIAIERLDEK